jgi:hypothetical protein
MPPVLAVLLLLLALPAQAQPRRAPEPPCLATGPQREAICADAELRGLDGRLRGLEASLLQLTSRPATMEARARAFHARLDAAPRSELAEEYQERIAQLNLLLRQDRAMRRIEQRRDGEGRAAGSVFPRPPTLERSCLGAALRDCRVTGAGLAASEDGRTRVLWQTQRGFNDVDGLRAGIVLLAEARGGWRLLGWSFAGHRFDPPRIAEMEGARVLHAMGRGGGSGSVNADLLYRLDAGGWTEIETESWREALATRLPPGLEVWQAVDYDMEEAIARSPLWREGDGNCCPSGGMVNADLRIAGRSLALDEIRLDAVARAVAASPPEACPAARAVYRLNAPEEWRAELVGGLPGAGMASDLVLRVTGAKTGRVLWFVFTAAQGYGTLGLLPVEAPGPRTAEEGLQPQDVEDDALRSLALYPMREDLTVLPDPPRGDQPPPRHLFTPGLGALLWYGGLPDAPDREAMSAGVWVLSGCRAAN